jgi:hypothetical protein
MFDLSPLIFTNRMQMSKQTDHFHEKVLGL